MSTYRNRIVESEVLRDPRVAAVAARTPDHTEVEAYLSETVFRPVVRFEVEMGYLDLIGYPETPAEELVPIATWATHSQVGGVETQVLVDEPDLKVEVRTAFYGYLPEEYRDLLRQIGKVQTLTEKREVLTC
jgi:hypothetical protein